MTRHGTWQETGGGGHPLGALLVVALAVALAGVAAGIAQAVASLLVIAAIVAGVVVATVTAGVVAFLVYRQRHPERMHTLVQPPVWRQVPGAGPPRELPREPSRELPAAQHVHFHFHDTDEDKAARIVRQAIAKEE